MEPAVQTISPIVRNKVELVQEQVMPNVTTTPIAKGVRGLCFDVVHAFFSFFYNILYNMVYYWFLNAPMNLPAFMNGYEGLPKSEICGKIMNSGVKYYVHGSAESLCDDIIEQKVTGRVTFILGIFVTFIIVTTYQNLPKLIKDFKEWWYFDHYARINKEKAFRAMTTRKRHRLYEELLSQITATARLDIINANILIIGVRTILDEVRRMAEERDALGEFMYPHAREVLDAIMWPRRMWQLRVGPNEEVLDVVNNVARLRNLDNGAHDEDAE